MKLTFVLLTAGFLNVCAEGVSQKVTFSGDKVPLEAVFSKIEKQTGFLFLYKESVIRTSTLVSVYAENLPLEQFLALVFKSQPLLYKVRGMSISVSPKILPPEPKSDRTFDFLKDTSVTVRGRVVDENGEPLSGASLTVKGMQGGTTSDEKGNFLLTVADNATTLVISYTGYTAQQISIRGKTAVNVVLSLDASSSNEVVVIGYGTQKKSDLTGSVSSVKGADLTKLPTQRVDQALQGRAAGVMVQNTDGSPGGNAMIRIRGGNSIIGSNNALVVVDGLQGVDISTINPNDVESLEVLKDASSTAIYGSRGANGVILITTKKGSAGKPVFNYSFSIGSQKLNQKLDLMKAGDYARKSNAWAATQDGTNSAPITPIIPFTEAQIEALDKSGGTDWQNEIFERAGIQNHLVSISGGNENTRYFVSGGYIDQQGIVRNTQYKRYTLRSNLDLKLTSWLTAGINLNVIKDKGNVPPIGEGTRFGDILGQVINTVARFDPATPVYDATGNYNFKALKGGPAGSKIYADNDVWNPLASALETSAEKNNIKNEISTFLEFKLMEGLTFRVTGAASITNTDSKHYYNTKTQPGRGISGLGDLSDDKFQFYQNSNILNYFKTFNKHQLTLTAVAEQQLIQAKSTFINAQGFFSDNTGIDDLGGASQINERYNSSRKQTLNSFLGRVNYTYDGKYMFTASYRADGSSVFGANNKWGYFPSAALAWRASEEEFIKDLNLFSNLKIRGSWGKTGNQAIQPYQTLATLVSGFNYPYEGNSSANIGFALGIPGNPDLKWESTAQTNLGIDLGFFNDRLTATVDIYKKKTTDLLLNKQVEAYTGFSTKLANVGAIENKGIEVTLGAKPVSGRDFRWNTSVTIAFNRSEVLSLLNDKPLAIRTSTGGGYQIWASGFSLKYLQVGQPVDQMRGFVNLGTWSDAAKSEAAAFGQAPGEARWKDVNGDGKITRAGDGQEIIGNASPDFFYGWQNSLSYKSFDLTFLIQGSQGNDIFNAVRIKTENPSNGTSVNLNNRWTPDNQNTDVPVFLNSRARNELNLGANQTAGIGVDQRSSRWVEDGSYLRLKNITLAYNLPASILSRIHVSRLSVYATAANIFTITKYTGYDPEVSSFNAVGAGGLGIDLSNYPTMKTLICGINLTF